MDKDIILKYILFIFVPLLLILIFMLPQDVKDSYFILNATRPAGPAFFLSNYTHSALDHLLENLLWYLIIIALVFHFETDKGRLWTMAFIIFIIAPFLVSFFTIESGMQSAQGFSGIVAGWIGYLPIAMIRNLLKNKKASVFVPLSIFLIAFSISYVTNPAVGHILPYLLVFALLSLYLGRNDIAMISESLKKKTPQMRFAFSSILAFSLLSLSLLISANVSTQYEGIRINIIGHYIGYIVGIFASQFIDAVEVIKKEIQGR